MISNLCAVVLILLLFIFIIKSMYYSESGRLTISDVLLIFLFAGIVFVGSYFGQHPENILGY